MDYPTCERPATGRYAGLEHALEGLDRERIHAVMIMDMQAEIDGQMRHWLDVTLYVQDFPAGDLFSGMGPTAAEAIADAVAKMTEDDDD